MTILGLSLIIFAAILAVAIFLMSTSSTQIDVDTAYRAVQGIRESADFIYVHGYPSKIQSSIHIPGNVEEVYMEGKVVRIRLGMGDSYTDVYAVTKANITGSTAVGEICPQGVCKEGYYVLVFEALDPSDPANPDVEIKPVA